MIKGNICKKCNRPLGLRIQIGANEGMDIISQSILWKCSCGEINALTGLIERIKNE